MPGLVPDIRPGGEFKVCMRSERIDHWLQGVYTEVVPPSRLSFPHRWLRADGSPGVETFVPLPFAELGAQPSHPQQAHS